MWLNEKLYASVEGGREALDAPALVHYTGGGKPWLRGGAIRAAAKHYWKYALRCPYADEIVRAYRESCLHSIAELPAVRRRRLWYQFLAFILWGRKRRHYMAKAAWEKQALSDIEKLRSEGMERLPWQD